MRRNRKRGKSRATVTSEDDDEESVGGLRGLSKSSQEKIEVSMKGKKTSIKSFIYLLLVCYSESL